MQQLMCKCNDHIFSAEIYEYCREAFCSTRRTSANHSVDRGSNSASVHFGGSNSASVHFWWISRIRSFWLRMPDYVQYFRATVHFHVWGISRIRSFWFRMQNQFQYQYFRAAIFNPFVSTTCTTPPY
jgi:hypothetical protein